MFWGTPKDNLVKYSRYVHYLVAMLILIYNSIAKADYDDPKAKHEANPDLISYIYHYFTPEDSKCHSGIFLYRYTGKHNITLMAQYPLIIGREFAGVVPGSYLFARIFDNTLHCFVLPIDAVESSALKTSGIF